MTKKLQQLKEAYTKACNDYLNELCKMWEMDASSYGWWVGDEVGETWCYEDDIYIGMSDIIYAVENKIPKHVYRDYLEYTAKCLRYNFPRPTFQAFAKGCPLIPQERFDRLEALQKDLDDYAKETRKLF